MRSWSLCSIFLLAMMTSVRADGPLDDLLRRVPEEANSILVVDVARVYTSPIAVTHNWEKIQERDYVSVAAGIPPQTRRLVVSALIEPSTFDPTWRVGFIEFRDDVRLSKLSHAVPGSEDEIDGVEVVLSTGHGYLVNLGPKLVGAVSPANRQGLGRWLRASKRASERKLNPYLAKSVADIGSGSDIVLAMDLADMFDSKGLKDRLSDARSLEGKRGDVADMVKELNGLVGLTFKVSLDKDINGTLSIDFRNAPEVFPKFATKLISEALDAMGLPLLSFDKWTTRVKGNSLMLEGRLTDRELRKIGAFLLPSTPSPRSDNTAAGGSGNPIELSRRYFRSVNSLIEDLRSDRAKTFNQLATLFQQYSKKIDELPILNVDPELVSYAEEVASTFRALATGARSAGSKQRVISTSAQEATVDVGGAYRYGYGHNRFGAPVGWNYYRPNYQNVNNYQYLTTLQTAVTADEAAVRNQVWKQIDDSTAKIRRKMTEKYMVEF